MVDNLTEKVRRSRDIIEKEHHLLKVLLNSEDSLTPTFE
jgi:hypothetical protein